MKTEHRFVFDTNVLVSAFLLRSSTPRQAFDCAISVGLLLYSEETLGELWTVLVRPKFDRYLPLADRIELLRGFEQIGQLHPVQTQVALCRDPRDDKFLSLCFTPHLLTFSHSHLLPCPHSPSNAYAKT